MAGRPRKPTALKLVTGNPGKRALNKREPQPNRAIPSCPSHLSDVAKVAWGRFSVLLDRMRVLTEADGAALERLCECYSEILECQDNVSANGRTFNNGLIRANPAVAMLADADRRFKSYLVEFGLTPAARTKVNAAPDDDKKADPLKSYFG